MPTNEEVIPVVLRLGIRESVYTGFDVGSMIVTVPDEDTRGRVKELLEETNGELTVDFPAVVMISGKTKRTEGAESGSDTTTAESNG